MLRQRIITAAVLLAVLLPALFYSDPAPFCLLAAIFIAAAAWEWARLAGFGTAVSLASGVFCATACLAAWLGGMLEQRLQWLWTVAAVLWVLGGACLLRGGAASWSKLPRQFRLVVGIVLLVVAWLAVAQARILGVNFLLSIFVLVWAADIFAYFTGRAFGGRIAKEKLAPSISPGKSWEGVWGGMAAVLVLALIWRWADGQVQPQSISLYSHLLRDGRWFTLFAFLGLAAMSVVGDLSESLVKRAASVKDSSNLLPGHGGVLDRVDALLPTMPLAMLLYHL